MQGFDNSFGEVMNYIYTVIPQSLLSLMEPVLDDMVTAVGEYGEELTGML